MLYNEKPTLVSYIYNVQNCVITGIRYKGRYVFLSTYASENQMHVINMSRNDQIHVLSLVKVPTISLPKKNKAKILLHVRL